MRKIVVASFAITLFAGAAALRAHNVPQFPAPEKEHEWLQQFIGEWETEAEAIVEPGSPPIKGKGTETSRAVGPFWIVSDIKATVADMSMTAVQTLGYNPEKKKYIGTWIDSMTNHLWTYEGTVDSTGKILTFEAEGPNPSTPGKSGKFKDVHEFKSKDHRTVTSSMLGEDGKWVTFMTGTSRRVK